eukprot:gene305-907_t
MGKKPVNPRAFNQGRVTQDDAPSTTSLASSLASLNSSQPAVVQSLLPKIDERHRRMEAPYFHSASAVEHLKDTTLTSWDVLTGQPKSVLACLIGAYAGFLFGIDQGYIGPIIGFDNFKEQFGDAQGNSFVISDSMAGLMIAIFALGALFTAIPVISSLFCDGLGRKWSVFVGGLIFATGAVIQSTASVVGQFLAGRFIGGCAIGILCVTVPMYLSEVSPKETRGLNGLLFQFMVVTGILVAALIDLGVQDSSGNDWRIAIYPQIGFGVLLSVCSLFMWESPRYLYTVDKVDGAYKILKKLRKGAPPGYLEDEWAGMVQELTTHNEGTWRGMIQPFLWRITLVAMLAQFFQQFVGVNAFLYYGSRIGDAIGVDGTVVQTIINAVNMVAVIPAMFLVERVGRTFLLKWGAVGMFVALLIGAIIGSVLVSTRNDGCYQDGWAACICTTQVDWYNTDLNPINSAQGQSLAEYCADQKAPFAPFNTTNGVTFGLLESLEPQGYIPGNPSTLPAEYIQYCSESVQALSSVPNISQGNSNFVTGQQTFEDCSYTKDFNYPVDDAPGRINKPVGWTIVAMVCVFIVFFEMSWGPVVWIYAVEIAPQNYRAKISGMSVVANWGCAAAIGYLTPALISSINFYSFLFFAGFNVLAFFYAWIVPESAGFPLEKMHWKFERSFGVLYEDGIHVPHVQSGPGVYGHQVDPLMAKANQQVSQMRVVPSAPAKLSEMDSESEPRDEDEEFQNDQE